MLTNTLHLRIHADLQGNSSNLDLLPESPVPQNTSNDQPLECNVGFYHDWNGTGLCRPECGAFRRVRFWRLVMEKLAVFSSFIGSVFMFVISLTIQRKRM